jgi:phosphoesterase RecJ-like protein
MVERHGDQARRQRRVGEAVREELTRLLLREVRDPELAWATITGIDVSPDLRSARVFFVATGGRDAGRLQDGLERAASFLQREIGGKLQLRVTPRLSFRYDESFDRADRIDALISESRRAAAWEDGDRVVRELVERLAAARRVLVATHANPDGDAIGSLLGTCGILRLMGKSAMAYAPEGVPRPLRFLPGTDAITVALEDGERFDMTLLLDTADTNLLPPGFPPAERRGILVVIDHHSRHGEMGDLVIRREAAAVGEIVFQLARELTWPIDRNVAECLYASIVSDTGAFGYSSTTAATHRAAADLLELGVDPWKVASALFESFSLARQRLLGAVASSLTIEAGGRFAHMAVTPRTLADCGATKADLDGLINLGRSVEGVEIAALLREEPDGEIKISFRSRGRYNVGDLAARFGGGGHDNAAGCTLRGTTIEEVRRTIAAAATALLDGPPAVVDAP